MAAVVALSPTALTPHPQNPRPRLTEAEVAELRASIEAHGQRQPCLVRPIGENGLRKYEVVIGHRRAFVGKLLGRDVPCLVEVQRPVVESLRSFSDESLERAMAEGHRLAGVLGLDLSALEVKVLEEIPDPKWWISNSSA